MPPPRRRRCWCSRLPPCLRRPRGRTRFAAACCAGGTRAAPAAVLRRRRPGEHWRASCCRLKACHANAAAARAQGARRGRRGTEAQAWSCCRCCRTLRLERLERAQLRVEAACTRRWCRPARGGGARGVRCGGLRVGLEEPLVPQRVRERCGLPCHARRNRRTAAGARPRGRGGRARQE